ncbi:MAG: response regulator transcription factor [Syntrophomonadaceae bacterium]|nr:response regulator transcription factor [Syntrophomonadaceae bacterium]
MVNLLLLEDDEYNRAFYTGVLRKIPKISCLFDTSDGTEALKWASNNYPHISLLSIDLKHDNSGLAIARQMRTIFNDTYIVFMSYHAQYAVESFDVHPYSYLLKPVSSWQLNSLVQDIIQHIESRNECLYEIIPIKMKNEIVHLKKQDIIFIEIQDHLSIIHTQMTTWKTRKSLDEFESILGLDFLRVHRSYIVNINKIKSVKMIYDRSFEIELWDYPQKVLMSRYFYPKYRQLFK